ncbi:unnamed protein product [Diamesa hyperborea]
MSEKSLNLNNNSLKKKEDHKTYTIIPYSVTRNVLSQDDLEELSGYDRHKDTPSESIRDSVNGLSFKNILYDFVPVLKWIPEYPVKKNLIGDIISGITVAVMSIPQGLAYGLLAGVAPIVGLYMAFFPVLIYFIFGTSRHISMGTFAVVSLMTAKIVGTFSDPGLATNAAINGTMMVNSLEPHYPYTPTQVTTAVAMMVGFFQLLMCFLRLGSLSSLLSEPLVNGFTTAAAVHVMVSQAKDLLGINVPRHKGAFKVLLSIKDIFAKIGDANPNAIYVSIVALSFMILMNEILKPWASKKCRFPIPAELMAVVGFTAISYALNLGTDYNVVLVGVIPTGLPIPTMPPFELLRLVAVDSIAVTIVSYSIVMSMALIFARKLQYEVKANQELLAMGLANVVGAFFSCIPLACSLSRSLIQQQSGGKTQLASVVSAGLILIVLLWVGPLFETLPRAVLASIIIVALKGMLTQVMDLKRFAREGVLEMMVWISTFVTVVIVDIDIGLLTGILVSLFALYIKGWKSYSCLLGQVPDTDIYVDLKTHKSAMKVPTIQIFRYSGSINFASRSGFKKTLFNSIGVDHRVIRRASMCESAAEARGLQGMRTLIIDLSAVSHLDNSGCKTFTEIQNEMQLLGCKLFLASALDCVYDALVHSNNLGEPAFKVFSTIHDAVLYSQG